MLTDDAIPSPVARLPLWVKLPLLAAVVFSLGYLCIVVPRDHGQAAPIWFANAVVLACLLRSRFVHWPWLIATAWAASMTADIVSGNGPRTAAMLSACNMLEYTSCALVLRRLVGPGIDIGRPRDLMIFVIAAAAACALPALLAAGIVVRRSGADVLSTAFGWGLADAMGLLVLTPALLALTSDRRPDDAPDFRREGWTLVLIAMAASLVFLQSDLPMLFAAPPFLLLAAWRLGVSGAVIGLVIVGAIASLATMAGIGPMLMIEDRSSRLLVLQTFLAVSFFTSLPIASLRAAEARLIRSLRAAEEAAQAAARAKAEFLANMSHEIRTPLTAVLGFSSLLASRGDLPADAAGHADRIQSGGRALLATVNDILDFSKLEAGQADIRPEPCDIRRLIAEAVALLEGQAVAKRLTLEVEIDAATPPWVMLDGGRVRQILLNLVGNAVKFTEHGGVTARLTWREGRASLSVTDTGPGLTEEACSLLFRKFSQVDASSTRRHGGTGLGLAICKGLAEAMGGDISVESRPGEGSTFRVDLPCPVALTPELVTAAVIDEDQGALMADVRVLAVDDNPANRELISRMLGLLGASCTVAAGGEAGIEAARTAVFDVILMDLRMPGVDGRQAAEAIRTGGGPNDCTPILAFTADAADLTAGRPFDGVLDKPLTMAGLVGALQAALCDDLATREADHAAA